MRLISYFLFCIPILFVISCASPKNLDRNSSSSISHTALQEKLYSKDFKFEAFRTFPIGSPMVDLSGENYSVIFNEDIINSVLPFYGTRYSGPSFGKSKGMRFQGKPDAFVIRETDNGFQVEVKVKTREDQFILSMDIRDSGNTTLTITTKTRSTITYEGEIR